MSGLDYNTQGGVACTDAPSECAAPQPAPQGRVTLPGSAGPSVQPPRQQRLHLDRLLEQPAAVQDLLHVPLAVIGVQLQQIPQRDLAVVGMNRGGAPVVSLSGGEDPP